VETKVTPYSGKVTVERVEQFRNLVMRLRESSAACDGLAEEIQHRTEDLKTAQQNYSAAREGILKILKDMDLANNSNTGPGWENRLMLFLIEADWQSENYWRRRLGIPPDPQ
jgi:hypothetical protein